MLPVEYELALATQLQWIESGGDTGREETALTLEYLSLEPSCHVVNSPGSQVFWPTTPAKVPINNQLQPPDL